MTPKRGRAVLEDFKEGYALGFHGIAFTKALIVCDTKFSRHLNYSGLKP